MYCPSQVLLLKNKGHRGNLLPLSYDSSNMGLLNESVELPRAVPDHLVPPPSDFHLIMPEATDISPEVWVGSAVYSRDAGNSQWVRFKPPRGVCGYVVLRSHERQSRNSVG